MSINRKVDVNRILDIRPSVVFSVFVLLVAFVVAGAHFASTADAAPCSEYPGGQCVRLDQVQHPPVWTAVLKPGDVRALPNHLRKVACHDGDRHAYSPRTLRPFKQVNPRITDGAYNPGPFWRLRNVPRGSRGYLGLVGYNEANCEFVNIGHRSVLVAVWPG